MTPADSSSATILTPRLRLSPVGPDDLDELRVLYRDPVVDRWTGPWTDAAIEAWTTDMTRRWANEGVGKWMARDRGTGTLVGRGGLTRMDLDDEPVLEVGWVLRDACTGRGYAGEIGRAAFDWADRWSPNRAVVAFTEVHNHASIAVMRRLGMRFVGTIALEGLIAGKPGLHADAPFALYRRRPPRPPDPAR